MNKHKARARAGPILSQRYPDPILPIIPQMLEMVLSRAADLVPMPVVIADKPR